MKNKDVGLNFRIENQENLSYMDIVMCIMNVICDKFMKERNIGFNDVEYNFFWKEYETILI